MATRLAEDRDGWRNLVRGPWRVGHDPIVVDVDLADRKVNLGDHSASVKDIKPYYR